MLPIIHSGDVHGGAVGWFSVCTRHVHNTSPFVAMKEYCALAMQFQLACLRVTAPVFSTNTNIRNIRNIIKTKQNKSSISTSISGSYTNINSYKGEWVLTKAAVPQTNTSPQRITSPLNTYSC